MSFPGSRGTDRTEWLTNLTQVVLIQPAQMLLDGNNFFWEQWRADDRAHAAQSACLHPRLYLQTPQKRDEVHGVDLDLRMHVWSAGQYLCVCLHHMELDTTSIIYNCGVFSGTGLGCLPARVATCRVFGSDSQPQDFWFQTIFTLMRQIDGEIESHRLAEGDHISPVVCGFGTHCYTLRVRTQFTSDGGQYDTLVMKQQCIIEKKTAFNLKCH